MKNLFLLLAVSICLSITAFAQTQSVKKHALAKVMTIATSPVAHPAKSLKATLGSALFVAENVVDVAHLGLVGADKAFDALSIQGKVPVIDSIYGFVSVAAKDSGKLDTWMEKQEMYLFGTSN